MTWGDCGALGGTRTPNLLIRRCPYWSPGPFRSVRDLGLVPHRLSGQVQRIGKLFVPVAPNVAPIPAWHLGGLVLVVTIVTARTSQGMARVRSGQAPA